MVTGAEIKLVAAHVDIKVYLHTLGQVVPGVVFVIQAAGVNCAVQNALGIGVSAVGRVDDASAAAELEPVPLEVVAIEGGRAAYGFTPVELMGQTDTGVGIVHLVDAGQPVAPVRVLAEVRIGQAEVTGVRGFLGILQLGGHALALSLPAQLADIVFDIKAGVAVTAVNLLEAFRGALDGLKQVAPVAGRVAIGYMNVGGAAVVGDCLDIALPLIRNGC